MLDKVNCLRGFKGSITSVPLSRSWRICRSRYSALRQVPALVLIRETISVSAIAFKFFPVKGSSELAHWLEIQFFIASRGPTGILLALRV